MSGRRVGLVHILALALALLAVACTGPGGLIPGSYACDPVSAGYQLTLQIEADGTYLIRRGTDSGQPEGTIVSGPAGLHFAGGQLDGVALHSTPDGLRIDLGAPNEATALDCA